MILSFGKFSYRCFSCLALALLVLGLGRPVRASAPGPAVAQPSAQLAVGLSVDGRLAPGFYANLAPQASGQVEAVMVQAGQNVQAGAVLLRLAGREQMAARLASAELERLAAQQALDRLDDESALDLAQERKTLAETQKRLNQAQDRLRSLSASPSPAQLEQAQANLRLAQYRLERVEHDLRFWEKRAGNKRSIYRLFLDKGQFKDILEGLERLHILAQTRVEHAQEMVDQLMAPADVLDVAQAQSEVSLLQARQAESQRRIEILDAGPDPDAVAAAQKRLEAAEAGLSAAQEALQQAELAAPRAGKVAEVKVKPGEWVQAGQAAVTLVDQGAWVVETDDLTELDAPQVHAGQTVKVRVEALPELELSGRVQSIRPLYEEKRGDVTYTARIALDESDPRLRWGMTVEVTFE
jgi:multidrug efflux pump subunit AcrA (membrane-fusion protein)